MSEQSDEENQTRTISTFDVDGTKHKDNEGLLATTLCSSDYSSNTSKIEASSDSISLFDKICLNNQSKTVRYSGRCLFITAILLLFLFLLIIPEIVKSVVASSSISVGTVYMYNPTNTTFDVDSTLTFTHVVGISIKAQMNTLAIDWINGENVLECVIIENTNEVTIKNNKPVTLDSNAYITNLTSFTDFNTYAVQNTVLNWKFSGTADILFLGNTKVNIDKDVSLTGFEGFPINPTITRVNTTNGFNNTLITVAPVTMTSTSNMNIDLDATLYFEVICNGTHIGTGSIPGFKLITGSVDLISYVNLTYSNTVEYNQIMLLLSNFSSGVNSYVTMSNFYLDPPISWLVPGFASIAMDAIMPGITVPLINSVILYEKAVPENMDYQMILYNPEECDMTVTSIVGSMYSNGIEIATVDNEGLNVVIPPHEFVTTPLLLSSTVNNKEASDQYDALKAAGGGYIDGFSQLGVNMADFVASFPYTQYNITLVMVPYEKK